MQKSIHLPQNKIWFSGTTFLMYHYLVVQ
jgi:hypothetical protein